MYQEFPKMLYRDEAQTRSGVLASGETPTAAEIRDAITTLSDMLDLWSLERLAVFGTTLLTLPVGYEQITVGPTGNVVGQRPNAFVSAYVRTGGRDVVVHQASNAYIDAAVDKGAFGDGHWLAFEGTMPNATQGWSPCSSRCSGEWASLPCGMAKAARTPAIVACTPDSSTASHKPAASSRKGQSDLIPTRPRSSARSRSGWSGCR